MADESKHHKATKATKATKKTKSKADEVVAFMEDSHEKESKKSKRKEKENGSSQDMTKSAKKKAKRDTNEEQSELTKPQKSNSKEDFYRYCQKLDVKSLPLGINPRVLSLVDDSERKCLLDEATSVSIRCLDTLENALLIAEKLTGETHESTHVKTLLQANEQLWKRVQVVSKSLVRAAETEIVLRESVRPAVSENPKESLRDYMLQEMTDSFGSELDELRKESDFFEGANASKSLAYLIDALGSGANLLTPLCEKVLQEAK